MQRIRLSLLAATLAAGVVLMAPATRALEIPPHPDGHVTDRAEMLSPAARQKLEESLTAFEKRTSTQIVLATFPSLDGDSLEDVSIRLAETWKIGQKGKNNGVIFLIFRDDRTMRIEVGYGLEGVLTDAVSGRIIHAVVAPFFKQGNYESGILAGINAIARATEGEFKNDSGPGSDAEEAGALASVVLGTLLAIIAIDLMRYGGYFGTHWRRPHRYSFWEWWFRFALLLFIFRLVYQALWASRWVGGGYTGGSGGFGSYSGGSDFGGFSGGGGSFGGGGASGSW